MNALRRSALLCLSMLAACGGGGGGGGSRGTLSVSTRSLVFSTDWADVTPSSQDVTATVTGVTGTLYVRIESTGPAVSMVSGVTITSETTGKATVYPANANTLGPGRFTGTITVHACTSSPACTTGELAGSPQTIDVTYDVRGVAASAPSLTYLVGNAPAPGDLQRSATVSGYPVQEWRAAWSEPWLEIVPTSGSTAAPVQVSASLSRAALEPMFNGTYTTTVAFRPDVGRTVQMPVTLRVRRSEVNEAAPHVAFSGEPGEVTIRGEELNQLAITGVSFDATSATSWVQVSDTELRATHGVLPAGHHVVHVQNGAGLDRTTAELVVLDAPVYASTVLPYPGTGPRSLVDVAYDAERQAVIVGTTSNTDNTLLRWAYGAGGWVGTSRAIRGLGAFTLTTDRRTVLAAAGARICHLDPATLASVAEVDTRARWGFKGLGALSDGAMIAAPGEGGAQAYRYVPRERKATPIPGYACDRPTVAASGDGSTALVGGGSYRDAVSRYDASTGVFTASSVKDRVVSIALDRSGSRAILHLDVYPALEWRVYDRGLTLLGTLPPATSAAVLSPDGARVYTFERGASPVVRTFDATAPAAGPLPEVGSAVTLAGSPSATTALPRMAISPDGGTLFIAGDAAVVVQPVR